MDASDHKQVVAPHVGAFANVMFCVSVIMLLVWDVCLQNERWISWVFYSRLGEVIAHLGWFVQEFHLWGWFFSLRILLKRSSDGLLCPEWPSG